MSENEQDLRVTVAEYYTGILEAGTRQETWDYITDGELNWKFAKDSFSHWQELLECVADAADWIGDQPHAGRITCAKVMVDAMLRLRGNYGLNAPRCWYPIITKLRATPRQTPRYTPWSWQPPNNQNKPEKAQAIEPLPKGGPARRARPEGPPAAVTQPRRW